MYSAITRIVRVLDHTRDTRVYDRRAVQEVKRLGPSVNLKSTTLSISVIIATLHNCLPYMQ